MPEVSVVIPIYNAGVFLQETLMSIINQSLKDYEIILVNDGSIDNSGKICEEFESKNDRIKYFFQENQGVSSARNKGIEEASGKYIFCMDADDTIDCDFLKTSCELANAKDLDIVVLGTRFSDYDVKSIPALPTMGIMIKKEFLDKYPDIRYPINIQPCEDGLFTHQLLALTDKIDINLSAKYFYRKHPYQHHKSIKRKSNKLLEQIPLWFDILDNFYTRHNLWNTKALHLAKFTEHEPYEFRFLSKDFNKKQKKEIFILIKNYMQKLLPLMKREDYAKFSKRFNVLINSKDFDEYNKKMFLPNLKYKFLKNMYGLIPNKKIRQELKQKLKNCL